MVHVTRSAFKKPTAPANEERISAKQSFPDKVRDVPARMAWSSKHLDLRIAEHKPITMSNRGSDARNPIGLISGANNVNFRPCRYNRLIAGRVVPVVVRIQKVRQFDTFLSCRGENRFWFCWIHNGRDPPRIVDQQIGIVVGQNRDQRNTHISLLGEPK
jgi:hypothetical protein